MNKKQNNYAYIDGANLHKGIIGLEWKFDYKRFRVWLSDKYGIRNAYLFIGLIPKYKKLYTYLQESGFMLVFKDRCSILLKRTGVKISYIHDQRSILRCIQKEKTPSEDGTLQGSFS